MNAERKWKIANRKSKIENSPIPNRRGKNKGFLFLSLMKFDKVLGSFLNAEFRMQIAELNDPPGATEQRHGRLHHPSKEIARFVFISFNF